MKNTTHSDKANGATAPGQGAIAEQRSDQTIEQVRDLLFGGARRSLETGLAELREEMQASTHKLQQEFAKELSALQSKLERLEQKAEHDNLASLRNIGSAVSELATKIGALGAERTGR